MALSHAAIELVFRLLGWDERSMPLSAQRRASIFLAPRPSAAEHQDIRGSGRSGRLHIRDNPLPATLRLPQKLKENRVRQDVIQIADTAGQWSSFEGSWISPGGSTSARCAYSLLIPGGESFDAYLDDLVLRDREAIFGDGFESGNTSAWSAVGD